MLRVGTTGEVRALGELARRGIHPPEEMPFGVAWSDRTALPGFLEEFAAFHREHLDRLDSRGAGASTSSSGSTASSSAPRASAGGGSPRSPLSATGSWLGREAQGRGIGTEMRAAALELAFRGLGAEAATSGWLEGNAASGRVSEKLGYRKTGVSEVSPRGTPVPHHDVRIDRARLELAGRGRDHRRSRAASRCSVRAQPTERLSAAASD